MADIAGLLLATQSSGHSASLSGMNVTIMATPKPTNWLVMKRNNAINLYSCRICSFACPNERNIMR